MKPDPIIDEIRRVRHELSAEIGHDPRRLPELYAAIQDECSDRLLDRAEQRAAKQTPIDHSGD